MSKKAKDSSQSSPEKPVDFPDQKWGEDEWLNMINTLRDKGFFRWEEVALLILESLNPPQVGTAQASSDGFKENYGKGNTMRVVMDWLYNQQGRCEESGTRLALQVDHKEPKQYFDNPNEADTVENLQLLSRRENVIRRESHVFGGQTHLPAAGALMWILLEYEPRTLADYIKLCRLYGMTMANIRMQEGWGMGHWLAKDPAYTYEMEGDKTYELNKKSDILLWNDNGITRRWSSDEVDGNFDVIAEDIAHTDFVYFLAVRSKEGSDQFRVETYRKKVKDIHFSHYFENDSEALAVNYSPPDRSAKPPEPAEFPPQPPREMHLLDIKVGAECDWSSVVKYSNEGQEKKKKRKVGSRTPSGSLRGNNGLKVVDVDKPPMELDYISGQIELHSEEAGNSAAQS